MAELVSRHLDHVAVFYLIHGQAPNFRAIVLRVASRGVDSAVVLRLLQAQQLGNCQFRIWVRCKVRIGFEHGLITKRSRHVARVS